ncbi:aspartyl-phosphate phosphatase Spo0E family protein [Paenibacillus prosopidis]|uniref:aspartyl-phosphate phosphatase Spo0E family protein n=1 Tax=Paenibacillus prosopidis TaxID=630520 RepID=UPI003CCC60CC
MIDRSSLRTGCGTRIRTITLSSLRKGGGELGKNDIEILRNALYQLALLHQYNFLDPDVIRKSQELDLLINEMINVKLGCRSASELSKE